MVTENALVFDLSTACVGVIASKLDVRTRNPVFVKSCPIIPDKFNPSILGYTKYKKRFQTPRGKIISSYLKENETSCSEAIKKRRDVEVRNAKNEYALSYIGEQINRLFTYINPSYIVAEKNAIFNGVLTSTLLSEVMGLLEGVCSSYSLEPVKIPVKEARKGVGNVSMIVKEFVKDKSEDELLKIPDITKRALRYEMQRLYGDIGLMCSTDDESDACVVFHYWLNKYYREG